MVTKFWQQKVPKAQFRLLDLDKYYNSLSVRAVVTKFGLQERDTSEDQINYEGTDDAIIVR